MTSKRTISALNEAGFNESVVKIVVFSRLDFPSGVKRFHTEIGYRNATHPIYGSEQYIGVGDFGGIATEIKESTQGAPLSMGVGITGIDSALINTALTENYFRRDAEIMIGLEDVNGDLIDDPEILFSGYMDKIDITMQQNSATMALNIESRATNLLTASDLRVTDEDLQAENGSDLLFEYVYKMQDLVLRWGSQTTQWAGGGSGTRGPGKPPLRLK